MLGLPSLDPIADNLVGLHFSSSPIHFLSLPSFLFGCCLKPISYSFEAGSSLPTLLSAYRSCFSFHFILSRCRCSAKSEQRSCASLISTTQRLICFLILLLLGPPLYGNRLDSGENISQINFREGNRKKKAIRCL